VTKTFHNDIQNVDLVVLGAGPAGVAAANVASKEGAEVVIIDEKTLQNCYSSRFGNIDRNTPLYQRTLTETHFEVSTPRDL
jgi:pyruvate/2-oxoglutarate dehydrogenase complex dihydrolipoamide dehydrogenase (E3) component